MNERLKEFAEQSGLLGPTSRVGNAHEAAERFAELVAAHEREACAKLVEDFEPESFYLGQLKNAAKTIRARNEK